eukprot:5794154-Pyramimonas_sp.AAC.1
MRRQHCESGAFSPFWGKVAPLLTLKAQTAEPDAGGERRESGGSQQQRRLGASANTPEHSDERVPPAEPLLVDVTPFWPRIDDTADA